MKRTIKKTEPQYAKIIHKVLNNLGEYLKEFHDEHVRELHDLIKLSVETYECNSAVICGPPQCGKSSLVWNTITKLTEANVITPAKVRIVKLSGILHKDDRLALNDIGTQLKYPTVLEKVSFQENILKILQHVAMTSKKHHCTIFILDNVELFCEHKNQVLLYNLFDICQSSRAPICVIGMTSHVDIMNLMEKRVLSRFSHRIILVNPTMTLETALKFFKLVMNVNSTEILTRTQEHWNESIDTLIKDKTVQDMFRDQLLINNSLIKLKLDCLKLISFINKNKLLLHVDDFKKVFIAMDSQIRILKDLTLLEMCLIISIKIQQINYDVKPFNFEMIYIQYLKLINRFSTNLIKEKHVILRIFQRLEILELILPVKKTSNNHMHEYNLFFVNLTMNQINEGIKLNKNLSTDVRQWVDNYQL